MARINKLSGASKSPSQVAQDLRRLLDDRAQPFKCVARLVTERGCATVAAVRPAGIRSLTTARPPLSCFSPAMALASSLVPR
jgi:hypothetical protein